MCAAAFILPPHSVPSCVHLPPSAMLMCALTRCHTPLLCISSLLHAHRSRTRVYIAGYHTCALLGDTTVKCFGSNSHGQLGVGDTTNRNTPTAVPGLSGVVQLGVGGVVERVYGRHERVGPALFQPHGKVRARPGPSGEALCMAAPCKRHVVKDATRSMRV